MPPFERTAPSRPPIRDAFTLSLVDAKGAITYQSSAVQALLGYDAQAMSGSTWFTLLREEDAERVRDQFDSLVSRGVDGARWIVRFRSANGGSLPVEVRARNLLSDPEVGGVLLSFRAMPAAALSR